MLPADDLTDLVQASIQLDGGECTISPLTADEEQAGSRFGTGNSWPSTRPASRDPGLTKRDIVLSRKERWLFFCLGLAPVLAWDCVFVSEAYFENKLGPAYVANPCADALVTT
jgi:hypothetical protein